MTTSKIALCVWNLEDHMKPRNSKCPQVKLHHDFEQVVTIALHVLKLTSNSRLESLSYCRILKVKMTLFDKPVSIPKVYDVIVEIYDWPKINMSNFNFFFKSIFCN